MTELESASKETKAAGHMSHEELCEMLRSGISKRGLTNTLSSVAVRVAGAPLLSLADSGFSRSCKKPKIPHPHQAEQ